jgi:glycosyltransferase involved in cell wall biosynthesis
MEVCMGKNKIDILLPTYNGACYIREQLNSILNQSYQDFVIIVRDDKSNDNTKEIIGEYDRKYPSKFKILEDEYGNLGVVNNIFELLKYSTGDYIMFCDQDDVWFHYKIKKLINYIKQKEAGRRNIPVLVFSDSMVTDQNLNIIDQSFMHFSNLNWKRNNMCNLMQKNIVQGASIIFNRTLLEKAQTLILNNYKKTDKTAYHDWWFALIASIFGEIYFYQRPLMYYRQHGYNLVGAKPSKVEIKEFLWHSKDKINDFRDYNYLIVNQELCNNLLKIYRQELSKEQIKVINHLKEKPSDMKEFFSLKLYKYYDLREITMRVLFSVINV